MRRVQLRLTATLLFTSLALLAFFASVFVSGILDFLYRDAAGLSAARGAAQTVALVAVAAACVSGLIVVIGAALQPARLPLKLVYVIPALLFAFLVITVLSVTLIGVGTTGTLLNIQGVGPVTLSAAWIAVAAPLAALGVVIAAARTPLRGSALRIAVWAGAAGGLLSAIAAVAMVVSVVILATNQPASFGRGGGFPPGGNQNAPNNVQRPQSTQEAGSGAPQSTEQAPGENQRRQGQPQTTQEAAAKFQPQTTQEAPSTLQPQSTEQAPSSFQPPSTQEAFSGSQPQSTEQAPQATRPARPGQNGSGGGNEGGFPPGGGGFGNPTAVVSHYQLGTAFTAVFAVLALGSAVLAVAALRAPLPAPTQPAPNYARELGLAVLSGAILSLIVLAAIQVVPVSRTNPPATTTIKWDSQQTQDLAERACMNCHSNETNWPWYAYVAPASWLTTLHVNDARGEMNLSELDKMPSFMRSMIANNMAMQLRAGTMPPKDFLFMHPEARLSDQEKQQLIAGLMKTFGASS